MSVTTYAPSLYRALNGVFCIYKTTDRPVHKIISLLQLKLAEALNELDQREPRIKLEVASQADGNHDNTPAISTSMDWADHPLGPRYQPEDFTIGSIDLLGRFASGVTVMGIGSGRRLLPIIKNTKFIQVFHIKGELGKATVNFTPNSNLLERSTYYHLQVEKLNRVVSSFQAAHQRHMFVAAGADPDSEQAYSLATQGLVRPTNDKAGTVIYNIKVINFKPPQFTLEVHCTNASSHYLVEMMHKIGLQSKTNAVCTQLQRIRYGVFNLEHALLMKHWDPHNIANNILHCGEILKTVDLQHRKTL